MLKLTVTFVLDASVTVACRTPLDPDVVAEITTPDIVPPVSVIANSVISTEVPSVCITTFEVLTFDPCFRETIYSILVNADNAVVLIVVAVFPVNVAVPVSIGTTRVAHEAVVPSVVRYLPLFPVCDGSVIGASAHDGNPDANVNICPFVPLASLARVSVAEAYRISPEVYPVNPVPPLVVAIVVADHVPVAIVPRVVRLVLPAHVDNAVFSTLPSPTIVDVIPLTVPVNVGLFIGAYVEAAVEDVIASVIPYPANVVGVPEIFDHPRLVSHDGLE